MALPFNRPQPAAESAATRYNRDVAQRNGDWQENAQGDLVYVGPSATGGRIDREYSRRGGDHYYTYSGSTRVAQYDADGRNDREYVNSANGNSAITGAKSDQYDEGVGK